MPGKRRNDVAKAGDMKDMDRRSFLKKTAVVSGATMAATLGCGVGKSEAATSIQGSTPPGCVVNPEIPPAPIPESSIQSTLNADVVIVGAGIAGLSAARAASEAGASVIVIEKAKTYQYRSSQYGVIDSKVHKHFDIKIDKNAAVVDSLKQMSFRADQRTWKYWADNSGAAFDWMLELAPDAQFIEGDVVSSLTMDDSKVVIQPMLYPRPAEYDPSKELSPSYPVTLNFVTGQGGILRRVYQRCLDKGCKFIFSTWARQLIRPDNKGRVQGVICQDKNGVYTKVLARKGIILAAGDYASNREMLAYYAPWTLGCTSIWMNMDAAGKPTNTGDGQLMGVWAGAKMEDGPHAWVTHTMGGYLGTDSFFLANTEGERFVNEDIGGQWLTNALYRQPGNFGWQIFDDKWKEQIIHMGISHGSVFRVDQIEEQGPAPEVSIPGMANVNLIMMQKTNITADTLKELAGKLNLEAKAQTRLLESIERYNTLCKKGIDEDFGKVAKRLFPIEHPPFHATKVSAGGMLVIMGGLSCDPETGNVLDKEYKRIDGLYVAGNTMGGRYLVDYPVTCAGASHGMALTQGRMVGMVVAGL